MVIFVFSPENPLEVIFAPVYMLINIIRNLTCWHAYILNGRYYFHVFLFSRVVIFAFFLGAKITTARKLMSYRHNRLQYDRFQVTSAIWRTFVCQNSDGCIFALRNMSKAMSYQKMAVDSKNTCLKSISYA